MAAWSFAAVLREAQAAQAHLRWVVEYHQDWVRMEEACARQEGRTLAQYRARLAWWSQAQRHTQRHRRKVRWWPPTGKG